MEAGDRLAEYRAYYRSRAERYASNPLYPKTAAAERAMADAVDAAGSMEELQAKAGELSIAIGRALARDQANARARVYAETAETIREEGTAEAISAVEKAADGPALVSLLAEIEQRTGAKVTVDEMTRLWSSSLIALENVEAWRTAQVPDRWRADLDRFAADALAAERNTWATVTAEAARRQPGWVFRPAIARAERHRRRVPLGDEAFEQRLSEHGSLIRGDAG